MYAETKIFHHLWNKNISWYLLNCTIIISIVYVNRTAQNLTYYCEESRKNVVEDVLLTLSGVWSSLWGGFIFGLGIHRWLFSKCANHHLYQPKQIWLGLQEIIQVIEQCIQYYITQIKIHTCNIFCTKYQRFQPVLSNTFVNYLAQKKFGSTVANWFYNELLHNCLKTYI